MHYEVIVIGGGPAGVAAAVSAADRAAPRPCWKKTDF